MLADVSLILIKKFFLFGADNDSRSFYFRSPGTVSKRKISLIRRLYFRTDVGQGFLQGCIQSPL